MKRPILTLALVFCSALGVIALNTCSNSCLNTLCDTIVGNPLFEGISIGYAGDTTEWTSLCSTPQTIEFVISGQSENYPPEDSLTVIVNFGDGTDTTFLTYNGYNSLNTINYFYISFYHTYYSSGSYSAQYIVTAPNGDSDTITHINELTISDSCSTISGLVYIDANNNCQYDNGEVLLQGIGLELLSSYNNSVSWAYTDNNGAYDFVVPVGANYEITAHLNYPIEYDHICPSSGSLLINSLPSVDNNFGYSCPNGFDLQGALSSFGFVPGFDSYIWPNVFDLGCLPPNGTITMVLDTLLTYNSSLYNPTNISGDTLTWNFNTMNLLYNWQNRLSVTLNPNAIIGDSVRLQLIINPIAGDINPANNIVKSCFPITGSLDSYIKTVNYDGQNVDGLIEKNTPLTYTIYFQNTRNETAIDLDILDALDANLDLSTLNIIGSSIEGSNGMFSHTLSGNIVRFSFSQILLPDSGSDEVNSHGYVKYFINQKPDLAYGTVITNNAEIYYNCYDPPIITNTVINTIGKLVSVNDIKTIDDFPDLYPNPVTDNLNISVTLPKPDQITVNILNITGQVIYTKKADYESGQKVLKINTTSFSKGMYFVQVNYNNGQKLTQKFIK